MSAIYRRFTGTHRALQYRRDRSVQISLVTGGVMPDAIGSALTDTNPNSCVDLRCDRHGKPWTVTESLIQFTAQWEAFRAHLYDNDGGGRGGNTTIGYGHLVHMGRSMAPHRRLRG
ncbi:hypothetical protein QFZ96_008105 [Paraburkholderia youngii]